MRINWIGVRNFLIIAALAGLVFGSLEGFGATAGSLCLIIQVLFVAALIVFGFNYFKQNELAWLVLKPWQRYVIIACGIGIAFLLIAGFPLLSERRDRADRGARPGHHLGRPGEPPLPLIRCTSVHSSARSRTDA